MSHQIELVAVPAALRAHGVAADYARVWRAAADGKIPAQRIARRWYVDPDDLPEIARILSPCSRA